MISFDADIDKFIR